MQKFLPYILLLILIGLPIDIFAEEKETLVFEAWSIHLESAGGWVAADKGFYKKLNVKEVQGVPGVSPIQQVINAVGEKKIAFGIDSPENIIEAREKKGLPLVALSVDFQNSAMRIISWKPIKSSKEIRGDFATWKGYETKVKCVVGKDWKKQFTLQDQGANLKPWLAGHWPMASAMTYNELITAQREVKKMKKRFYTIDYKDLGINWMGNVLFTTEDIVKKYPDIVQTIVSGRYKGFRWTFDNPRDTFQILKKTDETLDLIQEMDAVSPIKALMISPETRKNGFGYILPQKWERIAKDMLKTGLLKNMPDAKKFYTEKFPSGVLPK